MPEIIISTTDEEFVVFASCFCRDMPIRNVQVVIDDEPQFDEDNKPVMTDYTPLEWIEAYMLKQTMKKVEKGFAKLTLAGNPPNKELMQEMLINATVTI
jgi:hypothetical protein